MNVSLQVITPFAVLVLAAENRREMDDWVNALRAVASGQSNEQVRENMVRRMRMDSCRSKRHGRCTARRHRVNTRGTYARMRDRRIAIGVGKSCRESPGMACRVKVWENI